jgi:hypothetical protein
MSSLLWSIHNSAFRNSLPKSVGIASCSRAPFLAIVDRNSEATASLDLGIIDTEYAYLENALIAFCRYLYPFFARRETPCSVVLATRDRPRYSQCRDFIKSSSRGPLQSVRVLSQQPIFDLARHNTLLPLLLTEGGLEFPQRRERGRLREILI